MNGQRPASVPQRGELARACLRSLALIPRSSGSHREFHRGTTRLTPSVRFSLALIAMTTSSAASRTKRWSKHVTETSNALDLERGVFNQKSAHGVALSLKRSAERSRRRKADPFRSALSMLTFYVNRAGKNLSPERRRVLAAAKDELRQLFHRAQRSH
jgi:hypothetical protein